MYGNNLMQDLTVEEYNKHKNNDKFLHNIAFAHGVQGWGDDNKGLCYYVVGQDYRVSPRLQAQAKKDYASRKQEIVNSIGNKLVFVGMGMDFKPSTKNHLGNHRIRTYIKNRMGQLCFIEVGTGRENNTMRCDHALVDTKKDNSEWESLREQDQTEKRVRVLELMKSEYHPYTKKELLKIINKSLDCDFSEVEVYSYCLTTDDYTSKTPNEVE